MAAPCQYTGHTFGHYRIVEAIGAGGMGVVYKAHDERLNRDVALKVLPPNAVSDEQTRKRLRKEALTLSQLNHPNIASIYDFDTHEGIDFIVMELVDGIPLDQKIDDGPICESESLYLTLQVCDALQQAHSRGIVHRDLKPGNIIVGQNNHLKVLDFGLATTIKSVDATSTESLTEAGQVAGTLPYMAPELLQGRSSDVRSDIWSAGVVMYEMVSGDRPFKGQTVYELSSAILRSDPPSLPLGLSAAFKAVVLRCLRKDPGGRFQTAGEVRAALSSFDAQPQKYTMSRGWVGPVSVALLLAAVLGVVLFKRHSRANAPDLTLPVLKQLAILPLGSSNANPEMAAFSDGLDETLTARLTDLTRTHDLQVIPTSEIRSRGVKTLQDANQEFGVNLGLELGVQRSGEMVRVNYILVDAKTHRQLRGDTITAAAADPFALQDRVFESVAAAMDLQLAPQEKKSLTMHGTTEPAAYDFYVQGLGYLQDYVVPEKVENAIILFRRSLEKDPSYAAGSIWSRRSLLAEISTNAQQSVVRCSR